MSHRVQGGPAHVASPAEPRPGAVIVLTLAPNAGNTAPTGPIVASGVAIAPRS